MFEPGDQIGPYTIVRRLGAGGMGEVYQARHRHIGRDAAIKLLLADLSRNERVVKRFFTEARATAAIRHPGIVEVVDCDVHAGGRAYIVMEYLRGEDLAQRIERGGALARDVPAIRSIARQIAGALAAAHALGIVHRDLKPANVFLVAGGGAAQAAPQVKLLDFGVAKLLHDDGDGHEKTRTGSLLGTPTYMSPEQCRGAGVIDQRADVYALGCVLFEMFAGRPPFVRSGTGEMIAAHLVQAAPRVGSVVPGVPPRLDALVAQMLEKEPAARPQSMAEVLAALDADGDAAAVPVAAAAPAAAERSAPRVATLLMPSGFEPPAPPTATPAPAPAPPALSAGAGRFVAGGTQVMSAVVSRTTLGDTASALETVEGAPRARRRRWLLPLVAGGLAVAAVLAVTVGGPSRPRRPARLAIAQSATDTPAARPAVTPPPTVTIPVAPPAPAPEVVPVEISSVPAGAEVWLAGERAPHGRTPLKLGVRTGGPVLNVTLRATGYSPAAIEIDPAVLRPVSVVLARSEPETAAPGSAGAGGADKPRPRPRRKPAGAAAPAPDDGFAIIGD